MKNFALEKNNFFRERTFPLLTFYFQNFSKGINIHQKSKKLQILMAKGWNISFWLKNMDGQFFAKIFHCGAGGCESPYKWVTLWGVKILA